MLDVQSVSYTRKETQTWTFTGAPPTVSGDFRIYPATWSVSGHGSLHRVQGSNIIDAQWTVTVPPQAGQLAVFVRASDRKLVIRQWTPHPSVPGAVTGTRRLTVNGTQQQGTPVSHAAYEWDVGWIVDETTNASVAGSRSVDVELLPADLSYPGAPRTATATWQFTRGTAPPDEPGGGPRQPVPQLRGIDPDGVDQGANGARIRLTGQATHWQTGVTTADFGPDIAVASLTVNSATEAIATLNVAPSAAIGPRSISVTTAPAAGRPEVVRSNAFKVNAVLIAGPGVIVTPPSQTKAPVLPPPPPSGAAATSGKYRIILNGFRVNGATYDDVLHRDGKGDEVYAAAHVELFTRPFRSQSATLIKTAVHGNIQVGAGRVRAGTGDDFGGLLGGDVFPTGQNPAMSTANAIPRTFPLLLWEGTLSDGVEVLLVKPTLWEWDGDSKRYDFWESVVRRDFPNASNLLVEIDDTTVRQRITGADLTPVRGSREIIGFNTAPYEFFQGRWGYDRPIGLQFGDFTVQTVEGPHWSDLVYVITREAIEKAFRGQGAGGGSSYIFAVPMVDVQNPEWHGNYDLFLRVDRLPTPPPGEPATVGLAPPPPTERAVAPEPTSPSRTRPGPLTDRLGPAITNVNPASTPQWTKNLTITFTARLTSFAQGTSTIDLGPGITLVGGPLFVESPTRVLGSFNIAGDATPGPRAITIKTGTQVVTLPNGFTVTPRAAREVFQVAPDSGYQVQQNLTVTLHTPEWRFFVLGTTADFGPGISVASFAVQSESSARAVLNIDSAAVPGLRAVTLRKPLGEVEVFPGAFLVKTPALSSP